jgi:hypothetical protein
MAFFHVFYQDESSDTFLQVKGDADPPYRQSFEADDGVNAAGLAAIRLGQNQKFIVYRLDSPAVPVVTRTEVQLAADSSVLTLSDI